MTFMKMNLLAKSFSGDDFRKILVVNNYGAIYRNNTLYIKMLMLLVVIL